MKLITKIHDRNVRYVEYNTASNWAANFPKQNWVLIIVANAENRNYFDEIIRKAIDRDVIWITGVGNAQNLIHDMADDELLIRELEIEIEKKHLPEHLVMTIGEEDFEEGIFSGIFLPIHAEENLNEVIIIDVDKTNLDKIEKIVVKLKREYT